MKTNEKEDLTPTTAMPTSQAPAAMSGRPRYWPWLIALAGVAIMGLLFVRSRHTAADQPSTDKPQRDVPYLDGAYIRFSQGFAERNKLSSAAAVSGILSPTVHVTGTVDFDPDKVAAIGARIAGRVRSVFKLEGDLVRPGDVLAEIESAELGAAQAALLSARAHAVAALANERREKELAQAKISSNRDAELAAATAASARAELAAAEGRVKAMGGQPNGEPGVLLLQSPIAGRVVTRNLSRGQFVEPTLTAFKVADLSRVFVELAVFERDVSNIRVNDPVEFYGPGTARTQVSGRVAYVGDEIDLGTKTASVRVIVDQPAVPLRPGQSVMAKIQTSAKADSVLVLPRDSVTSVDGKPTVFVMHGALAVEPRAIQLGRQDGQNVEVVTGLSEGEHIVVAGVFALKSEIFR